MASAYAGYHQRSIAYEDFEKLILKIETLFSMRHSFLCSLEKHADIIKVSGNIQLDETFVVGSHKSRHIEGKVLKTRGIYTLNYNHNQLIILSVLDYQTSEKTVIEYCLSVIYTYD